VTDLKADVAVTAETDAAGVTAHGLPVAVALGLVVLVLGAIVLSSRSAWVILGAGRGVVPERLYPLAGFLLVLGTTLGQAAGWAAGSFLAYHVMTRVGFAGGWTTARLAVSVVYLGLATFPLFVYHVFYGGWLLGMPRVGLEAWLQETHPDAYWLLIPAHPVVDLSLVPLAVLVLGLLWGAGDRLRRRSGLQVVFWLALFGTSLAVALSLAIHSALVHVRL
jgi:hypothetical protein